MSASNIHVHTCEEYNFYEINTEGKKYIIGGVPDHIKDIYINAAKDADRIILLTSKPEFCGGLIEVLDINSGVKIFASSAGLRNIKEIVNREINENLIKDSMELDGFKFYITPNIHWVDTVMVSFNGTLFSGEMFSRTDSIESYYRDNLAVNRGFVKSALERLVNEGIGEILPAIGEGYSEVRTPFAEYSELVKDTEYTPTAVVLYKSEYGYTASMAEVIAEKLLDKFSVYLIDVKTADAGEAIEKINNCDFLAVGTNTINRNAPKEIWDAITGLDLINMRGTPYFVFGSYGWAGDGIKLIDKTLSAMGLRPVAKPIEVLFKPTGEDFRKLEKVAQKANEYTKSDE